MEFGVNSSGASTLTIEFEVTAGGIRGHNT